MKKNISIFFSIIVWFAVITQFILMIEHRVVSPIETTIRFFSFFTILTNTLVALYFSFHAFQSNNKLLLFKKPGSLTAITVYISVVGLIYQFVLRQLWHPEGLDRIVDELLHTVIPLLVVIFWYLYEEKQLIRIKSIINWLVYPFTYLVFILIRGSYVNYYPYPFVNVTNLGLQKVLVNSTVLILFFILLSLTYIFIGKKYQSRSYK